MAESQEYRRAVDAADAQAFSRLVIDAFAIPEKDAMAWPALLGLENLRLLGFGEKAQAGLAIYPMGQWYGGRSVPTAGVAGVAVQPQLRGRGVASRLLRELLQELSARGVALSSLYPASVQLYGRAGFAIAGGRFEVRARMSALPHTPHALEIVRLADTRDPRMRACYARAAALRNGWLERSETMWARVREQRSILREGWAVKRDGEFVAYVWFSRVSLGPHSSDVVCSDLVAVDREAAAALLAFLGSYSTVCKELVFFASPADPLLDVLPELTWKLALLHPWMLRIVDAQAAIAARGFCATQRAQIDVEIADDVLAKNHGRFTLRVEGGRGTLQRGGAGRVHLDVRALAALYSGARSAEALAYSGIAHGSPEELAQLSSLFAGPAPSTPEMY